MAATSCLDASSTTSAPTALRFLDARSEQECERYRTHPDPLYAGVDLADPTAYRADVANDGPLEACVERILALALEALESEEA